VNETVITDANGRKLTLRKLNVLDQVKLLRAIGPQQSNNEPYVTLVNVAASVASIDGVPMPPPVNERQIDAAIARLDDEGFNAISAHMRVEIAKAEAAAEAAVAGEVGEAADPLPKSAS
jgi:hypothetical protein